MNDKRDSIKSQGQKKNQFITFELKDKIKSHIRFFNISFRICANIPLLYSDVCDITFFFLLQIIKLINFQ